MNGLNEGRFQPQLPAETSVERVTMTAPGSDASPPLSTQQRILRQELLIHQLFEERAKGTPGGIAVEHEGRRLTYAQLNRRANQLARYLSSEGVGPGEVVGICMESGLDMVAALLAIVKAGGTCLPLDPNSSRDILQQTLEDAVPAIVLTETELIGVLPATQARVIALNDRFGQIAGLIAEDLRARTLGLTSATLVYVIYTSASAGPLRRTAVRHSSILEVLEWQRRTFWNVPGRRVLQLGAQGSEVAFQEIVSALCLGGTLVLLDEWIRRDANALAAFLIERSIERLFVSPLMLQGIADRCMRRTQWPQSLKDLITDGEALCVTPEMRELFEKLEGCRLHSQKGSDNARPVLVLAVDGTQAARSDSSASGRENAHTQTDVLEGQNTQAPAQVLPNYLSTGPLCMRVPETGS